MAADCFSEMTRYDVPWSEQSQQEVFTILNGHPVQVEVQFWSGFNRVPESGAVLRAGEEAILARLGRVVPEGVHEGPLRTGQDLAGLGGQSRVIVAAELMQTWKDLPYEDQYECFVYICRIEANMTDTYWDVYHSTCDLQ